MKKIISFIIAAALLCTCVFAAELPHEFWALNDWYTNAKNSGDYRGIIDSSLQTLELLNSVPETEQTVNIKASRTEQAALAYEATGDYDSSADMFTKYAQYAKRLGWDDAVKIAGAKALQYKTDIRLYRETLRPVSYFGARLEPAVGTYFGLAAASEKAESVPRASSLLLYLEFGERENGWFEKTLKRAQDEEKAVVFAWNMPGEGSQIASVESQDAYVNEILSTIEKYNTVPVFVRFAAEADVWTDRADPEQYKAAFRYIAGKVRALTTNTAMVWSVDPVASWDINVDDYYPGDEYVDWVGLSLYMQKYFLGRNDWAENEKFNEVVFLSGDNADPVKAASAIISKYGDRKPVMISESGAAHTTRTVGDTDISWAKRHLDMLYSFLPMVYPQVKLINHFDLVMPNEANDYALSDCPELLAEYLRVTDKPEYITKGAQPVNYEPVYDGGQIALDDKLSVYPHVYKGNNIKVNYFADGRWIHSSDTAPYTLNTLEGVGEGNHTLRAVIESDGAYAGEISLNVNIVRNIKITVNGKVIRPAVPPMLVNDTTLVPVRVIAEALDADVKWDGENQKVYITKDGEKLELTIGDSVIRRDKGDITLLAPPIVHADSTMVPIRAISEALNTNVDWNDAEQTVIITSK